MATVNHALSQHQKDFIARAQHFRQYSPQEAFCDFLAIAMADMRNAVGDPGLKGTGRTEREVEYLGIVHKYFPHDYREYPPGHAMRKDFEALLALHEPWAQAVAEDRFVEFFGEVAAELNILQAGAGQFFTPVHVCQMIAKMTVELAEDPKGEPVSIGDPACGSGRMLLEAARAYADAGQEPGDRIVVCGTDISQVCYQMTTLQLWAAGIPAVTFWGNSLSPDPPYDRTINGFTAMVWYRSKPRSDDQPAPAPAPIPGPKVPQQQSLF